MIQHPVWIPDNAPATYFPEVDSALCEPNGLLAIGGTLEPERLVNAYRRGIFPWYIEGQPILWWSPDPRMVLFPEQFHASRSLRKRLRRNEFEIRDNTAFGQVMRACAEPRPGQDGTWITEDMLQAYQRLHQLGYAHCLECWHEEQLVGGVYGVAIGKVFFGESMFSTMPDASKAVLWHLCRQNFDLIDCQVYSAHLNSLGAEEIPRRDFCALLRQLCVRANTPIWGTPPPCTG